MKDETPCVVVTRRLPSHDWAFMVYTERVSVALESARQTQDQERLLGSPRFEAKVMRRKDWEANKRRARIQ